MSIMKMMSISCKMLFVNRILYPVNKFIYMLGLRGIGILNYENKKLSGDYTFLKKFFSQRKENVVVFDIGANVGEYSKIVRGFNKNAAIYAFEPHPVTFKTLKENASLYNFSAFCFGCGEKEGKLKFYDYNHDNGSSHASFCKDVIEKIHKSIAMETEAVMVRLDNFVLNELQPGKIDLLKIDTEGYDFMVLKGAEKLIRENLIDIIQFEFNEMNVMTRVFFKDFYDLLFNYNFYRLLPDGPVSLGNYDPKLYEIFAFQNIVAIRKDLDFCL